MQRRLLCGVSYSSFSRVCRASASEGVHLASAGSERGTSTCGRAHRARVRRNLRSAGSCGGVSHSSSSRVRRASASDGIHAPAPAVSAASAPVVVHFAPEPAATYAAQAPVLECLTSFCNALAPVMENLLLSLAVSASLYQ